MPTSPATPAVERFIDRKELKRRGITWANNHMIRLELEGRFPRRVTLGPQTVVWRASEIDAWMQARIDERFANPGAA